ncbi:MAG: hypothetical protein EHM57_01470 [Actinobacteria bacterium]|nr:MAG: hypothetical protein EHM57_01470 [Actinomycetota bacterium]
MGRRSGYEQARSSVLGVDVVDVLGLDSLLAQLILAVGLAMVLGNGYAIYKHRKGEGPKGAQGEFRPSRAYWLLAVGAVITVWGGASLLV